jgi:hypothetical protein
MLGNAPGVTADPALPCWSAHGKASLADRLERFDLHVVDPRTRWTFAAPCNHPRDRGGRSFEFGFDRTVAAVPNKTGDT